MPTIQKQGYLTVQDLDGMFRIDIEHFAVSIAAKREDAGTLIFDHDSIPSPPDLKDVEQIRNFGIQEAKKRWLEADGWTAHSARVAKHSYKFDLAYRQASK